MSTQENIELRQAIRSKYAWPGGYPMFLLMSDGECLCMDCAKSEYRQIAYSRRHNLSDGWKAECAAINWEDTNMICAHCNKEIESAHGE